MELDEEKKLVKRAQKDTKFFSELYEEYYPKIFGYILRRTANLQDAQDVTSETFLKALKGLKRFRWRGISFSAWLYRIATNEVVNYFRKKNNHHKVISSEEVSELVSPHNSPLEEMIKAEEELEKHKEFLNLHQKISQLPLKYQQVISLRFFEEKKIKEMQPFRDKKVNINRK